MDSDDKTTVLNDIYLKTLEALPDAVVVVNELGVITVCNQQTEFLFGFSRFELIGHPITTLVPQRLRQDHDRHVQGYVANPGVREMGTGLIVTGVHRSGRELPITIKLSPIMIAEAGLHVIAVIRRYNPASDTAGSAKETLPVTSEHVCTSKD